MVAGIVGETIFKGGKALMGEVFQEAGQQMSKHGEVFSKRIFGDNIPDNARHLFNDDGFSIREIDIFNRAMDTEPEIRGNLETLIRSGADGNMEAFDILSGAADEFNKIDVSNRALSKAQSKMDNNKIKLWNQQMGAIQQAGKATGDKGRSIKAAVQTDFKGPKEHTSGTKYDRHGQMITNRHHAIGLDDANNVWSWHRSAENVTPNQQSPILQAREAMMGIKSGNYEENMVDLLDSITRPSRTARIEQIGEMTDGILDGKTVDDALGMTGSGSKKPYNPRELNAEELARFETLRQEVPDLTVEDFMTNMKTSSGRKFTEGSFPDIRVYAPGTVHTKGAKAPKPLEVIKITNAADHKNRFNLIFDALERNGINVDKARKSFDLKKLEIDTTLDIYGIDHPIVHNIINNLKLKEGTALFEIQKLGPEGVRDLPLDEAIKLDIRSIQEMETVLGNVLIYRYDQVAKLFKEMYPNGYKGLKESFGELGAEAKRSFFKENINTIAVRGNIQKAIGGKAGSDQ